MQLKKTLTDLKKQRNTLSNTIRSIEKLLRASSESAPVATAPKKHKPVRHARRRKATAAPATA